MPSRNSRSHASAALFAYGWATPPLRESRSRPDRALPHRRSCRASSRFDPTLRGGSRAEAVGLLSSPGERSSWPGRMSQPRVRPPSLRHWRPTTPSLPLRTGAGPRNRARGARAGQRGRDGQRGPRSTQRHADHIGPPASMCVSRHAKIPGLPARGSPSAGLRTCSRPEESSGPPSGASPPRVSTGSRLASHPCGPASPWSRPGGSRLRWSCAAAVPPRRGPDFRCGRLRGVSYGRRPFTRI